ncbi:rust resistance kinase Lr10-like isoform X1 [Malus sylvestris]|uniref:rust resistance kinase Lr10-like isoform X1 n=1 Tax=Malus sylvestris TaxID=3752 RepID=UPI0021AD2052|nr:rust resistance kinase Lr10-like isoform X1 [Malus sylvestris]XP_050105650.1 rust resistance kinase Lr10-like isoform X1 [Malus sylvestris]
MQQQQLNISWVRIFSITLLTLLGTTQNAYACEKSKCGDHGEAIHILFRRGHPCSPTSDCHANEGDYGQEHRVVVVKFLVKRIDYKHQEVQVYQPRNCLLLKPLEVDNINISLPASQFYFQESMPSNATLFHCPAEREFYSTKVPCISGPGYRVYAIESSYETMECPFLESCTKMYDVLSIPDTAYGYNGTYLKWKRPNCTECEAEGNNCRIKYNHTNTEIQCVRLSKPSVTRKFAAVGTTLGSFVVLLLVVAAYRVYSSNRKEKEIQLRIETFLEDYNAHKPSRYSYADIQRITNQFRDKLGQGAYGTVFKGKLSSECFVAVKVLNSSNGNGEDFIKEVGMMGSIHHVNVVRLVGFCADGFNRALVYEFFANGSLHDFISSADNNNRFLGWDKLQDIALAVAKGIYYLHQECEQRILHFDIKPHNVLLDDNFTPKISDFGLAKLCSKDQSIVSMTTTRGTMGYIAPEVFSRNFGNVSYKSDVYSFGMLLLEMVGGRKNIDSTSAIPTEIYYPEWIYNLLEEGDDLRIHLGEEGDGKTPKKLAIVGLWCIQWHPAGRPSMKEVVQMLEGGENLTMPPNPFASTSPARTNATTPARNQNSQLEAIAELE